MMLGDPGVYVLRSPPCVIVEARTTGMPALATVWGSIYYSRKLGLRVLYREDGDFFIVFVYICVCVCACVCKFVCVLSFITIF